jgi:hypothetical protein
MKFNEKKGRIYDEIWWDVAQNVRRNDAKLWLCNDVDMALEGKIRPIVYFNVALHVMEAVRSEINSELE